MLFTKSNGSYRVKANLYPLYFALFHSKLFFYDVTDTRLFAKLFRLYVFMVSSNLLPGHLLSGHIPP